MSAMTERAADAAAIRPFTFEASEADLDDLRARIAATRWPEKETRRRSVAGSRSVLRLIWKCAGFIFCEFFSNVDGTGCRRGRTPERPLRQPSRVWLIARPFRLWPGLRGPLASSLEGVTNFRRSQIGHAKCCAPRTLPLRWSAARFRFVINGRGGTPGGRTQKASDVPAEIARPFAELRSTAPCRECPGRSGGGEAVDLSRVGRRESRVKRSRRCIFRAA